MARAATGEEIEITEWGRPVARLVPLRLHRLVPLRLHRLDQLADPDRLRPARRPPAPLPPPIELPEGRLTASEVLAGLRGDPR